MNIRNRQLILGLALYLFGSLLFAVTTYLVTHRHLISDIDQRLNSAAQATKAILGDNLHQQDMTADTISTDRDLQLSMQLTNLARQLDVAYIYSLIQIDGDLFFVTSNATEQELADDSYEPAYLMPYPEADPIIDQVFAQRQIRFSQYIDRWGEFRSIFIPFESSDGRIYVVGADISVDQVEAGARFAALLALGACLFMAAVAYPLIYFYQQSIKRESQAQLERLYRCPLTGLPNRNRLLEDLKQADIANVSVINIDKFREVVTLYGPAIGDHVLKQFSLRLSRIDSTAVDNYKTYRLHGDEFATLVTGQHPPELLAQQLQYLYNHLTKNPYQAGLKRLKLRVRMGAASGNEDAFTLAGVALREARETNKSIVIYDRKQQLPEAYRRNFDLTQQLRTALDEKRFVPYYQPLLNTTTAEFEKYECLARMVDNEGNVICQPDDFLPVAYRSRLYHRFSEQMLETIFSQLSTHEHTLSINLSVSDVNHPPTTQLIFHHLAQIKNASQVEFEIMENENIDNLAGMVRFIQKAKSFGCKVGLDDLGKDYSNIDRLIALPVDFVKIDGNIIQHIAIDTEAQHLARMIISFAYKKKIKTVAEFCCDGKTSDMARRLGVDYLQGYHIGKPQADFQPLADAGTQGRQLESSVQ